MPVITVISRTTRFMTQFDFRRHRARLVLVYRKSVERGPASDRLLADWCEGSTARRYVSTYITPPRRGALSETSRVAGSSLIFSRCSNAIELFTQWRTAGLPCMSLTLPRHFSLIQCSLVRRPQRITDAIRLYIKLVNNATLTLH